MLKMHKPFYLSIVIGCLLTWACNSPFVPKSKGYSALQFPQKAYQVFDAPGYPYSFEYPVYAQIDNKVNYFGTSQKDAGWINIQFPQNRATIYVSYRKVQPNQLDTLIRDAYTFASNHNNKASFIEDSVFTTQQGVRGVFFHIGGNVATSYQFFLTDSARHFFRGALYFDTTPNEDSLAPVNAFLFKDLAHLVNTFKWQ
jgi:gliding motility-associated lipoprotein GldD